MDKRIREKNTVNGHDLAKYGQYAIINPLFSFGDSKYLFSEPENVPILNNQREKVDKTSKLCYWRSRQCRATSILWIINRKRLNAKERRKIQCSTIIS